MGGRSGSVTTESTLTCSGIGQYIDNAYISFFDCMAGRCISSTQQNPRAARLSVIGLERRVLRNGSAHCGWLSAAEQVCCSQFAKFFRPCWSEHIPLLKPEGALGNCPTLALWTSSA